MRTLPPTLNLSLAAAIDRARNILQPGQKRHLLGITGAPGAGKSTLAQAIVDALGPAQAAYVPMDGFHLADSTLAQWQRQERKGAWDTFDSDGYVHLLARLRAQQPESYIHAPRYSREIEAALGSALPIAHTVPLIVTEGNYLLSNQGSWSHVAPLLDSIWYLELNPATRQKRLIQRHIAAGKSPDEAQRWTQGSDEDNARHIALTQKRAQLILHLTPSF